ncbi:carotenoid ester lipase precursor [Marasmius fiardii PR-910]|nr:carotenoid ester lipase precursor [Marasmius fiardii PR-910]
MQLRFWTIALQATVALAAPLAGPTVTLNSATVTGTSSGKVSKFLGIPFAEPPTGDRRFRLPEPIAPYTTSFSALSIGPACPQQAVKLPILTGLPADAVNFVVNSIFGIVFPDDEDCLTINIIKPADATESSKLPVVAWIFGGGFELGSPQMYDGTSIVERSIELGQPVIYVSMNYRVTGFGFLASKEVKAAGVGNLGLQDQREALRWIQKYIGAFGGDPTKVTIWGESAGAISVALQMLADGGDTKGLYRASFMQSGSPIPVGDITNGQKYYDAIVQQTGCSGSSDTLACLRTVPYAKLKAAIDNSPGIFAYQSLNLAWLPRADGTFLSDNPQKLVQQGKVAKVPIVSGDCDDEGTLFSLSTLNVTTESQIRTYIKTQFLSTITDTELDTLLQAYPQDIMQGSPFDTGIFNAISPQFKRFASFQGDAVFQAPRRFFLQNLSGKQKIWSFLSKRGKVLPILGSAHGTDILNVYGGGELADYLIRFATNLDPNGSGSPSWPEYTTGSPSLMTFVDDLIFPTRITQDTYRKDAMNAVTQVTLVHPV